MIVGTKMGSICLSFGMPCHAKISPAIHNFTNGSYRSGCLQYRSQSEPMAAPPAAPSSFMNVMVPSSSCGDLWLIERPTLFSRHMFSRAALNASWFSATEKPKSGTPAFSSFSLLSFRSCTSCLLSNNRPTLGCAKTPSSWGRIPTLPESVLPSASAVCTCP